MGRLAASIGFAFGTGISAGISEKRRQDAADKRSRELRDAAVSRIAKQQENAIALQQNADAIKDANILQQKTEADAFWRPFLEGEGINTKNLPGLLNSQTGSAIIGRADKKAADERVLAGRQQELDVGIKITEMLNTAAKESSPGGKKITGGEIGAIQKATGESTKTIRENIKDVLGVKVGKTALEKDLDIELKLLAKVFSDFGSTPEQKEAALQKVFDIRKKVRIESGILGEEEILSPLQNLNTAVREIAAGQNVSEQEAFQMILDSQDEPAQKATLALATGSSFLPVEQAPTESKFVGIGKSLIKARSPFEDLPERGPFGGFAPVFSKLAEKEESAFARRVRLNVERRKKGLKDEPFQERFSGFGQSLLPALLTVPAESTVDITPLGRKKKKKKNR